jgi:hypothetical protein
MAKFSPIPDFTSDISSMAASLRIMKDIVEQLAGLRQGGSVGSPMMYIQSYEPVQSFQAKFRKGDLWISAENTNPAGTQVTSTGNLYYWTGYSWQKLTALV